MREKIILITMGCFLFIASNAQRNVHWIHGLGGDGGSWQPFATDFNNERQILINTTNNYPTGGGVGDMVSSIQNQISNSAYGNSIVICHSMGGVAARQIDVQNNGFFGGIMTFGSPMRGAKVATNIDNGVATQYINNAFNRLLSGPQSEPILNYFITYFQNKGNVSIQHFAGDIIIQEVRNQLTLTPSTISDLAEESSYNQGYYGSSTHTPKLVFWGNENSPLHVRLAAGASNNDEEQWVSGWNGARGFYGFMRDYNNTLRWTMPWLFSMFTWRANQWSLGYDYLWDQSENEWSNLIGAGYSYQQTITEFEYVGNNFDDYNLCIMAANGDPSQIQACEGQYFQWVSRTITVFVRDQSDGLVPRRSQIAENTAWSSNAEIRELPGNNHQEMRRSVAARDELNRAFNSQSQVGLAFSIPYR